MATESTRLQRRARRKLLILTCLAALLALIAGWLIGPIAQDPAYHSFADRRALAIIPHAADVLSNLPFCLFGLAGLYSAWRERARGGEFTLMYLVFFGGVLLTGFGSAYYHFAPTNASLVWDRLPMAIAFMSLLALLLAERLDRGLGLRLLPWLVLAGLGSVLYWHFADDLRAYVLVQFGSMLLILCLLLVYRRGGDRYLWLAFGFYALAKIFEVGDAEIFALTSEWVSGHSLKHLAASLAPLMLLLRLGHCRRQFPGRVALES